MQINEMPNRSREPLDYALSRIPSATMQTNQMIPVTMVIRSRFRSTTEEEPSDEVTPPPNKSDRPPPLPLCRSTSSTISRLVMIKITENATVTAVSRLSRLVQAVRRDRSLRSSNAVRQLRPVHDTGKSARTHQNPGSHHQLAHRRRPARP